MSEYNDNKKVPLYTNINNATAEHGKTLSVDLTNKILSGTVNFRDVEKDLYQRIPIGQVTELKAKLEQAQKHGAVPGILPSSTYKPADVNSSNESQASDQSANKNKPTPTHL